MSASYGDSHDLESPGTWAELHPIFLLRKITNFP